MAASELSRGPTPCCWSSLLFLCEKALLLDVSRRIWTTFLSFGVASLLVAFRRIVFDSLTAHARVDHGVRAVRTMHSACW
jgi:hypothetical protein